MNADASSDPNALRKRAAVISAQDHIDQIVHEELERHIILCEDIRAFIHPVIPVMPIVYRSKDDIAEALAVQAERATSRGLSARSPG